jgi:hypothetical protein
MGVYVSRFEFISKRKNRHFSLSKSFLIIKFHSKPHVPALIPPIKMFRPYFRPSKLFGHTSVHQNVSALLPAINMFRPYLGPSKLFGPTSVHQNVSTLLPAINMFRPYLGPSKLFGLTSGHQHVSALPKPIKTFRPYFRPSNRFGPTSGHQEERQQNFMRKNITVNQHMDWDSSVGIATRYELNVSGIEPRCR